MIELFIALGSNIAPEHHLPAAVSALAARFELVTVSQVYQSAPVGMLNQADFWNAATLVRTALTAGDCKTILSQIEASLGRVRGRDKYGPRTIDLDIVLYGHQLLLLGERHIPDPDLLRWAHVAVPVAELAPAFVHPETGETLAQIAARLNEGQLQVRPEITLSQRERKSDAPSQSGSFGL